MAPASNLADRILDGGVDVGVIDQASLTVVQLLVLPFTVPDEVLAALGPGKRHSVLPAWRAQGWLEPHLVLEFYFPAHQLWQVALTGTTRDRLRTGQSTGVLVDVTPVDNYFQAVIVRGAVLELVDPWRVEVPSGVVRQARGRTQCWKGHQVDLDTVRQQALSWPWQRR